MGKPTNQERAISAECKACRDTGLPKPSEPVSSDIYGPDSPIMRFRIANVDGDIEPPPRNQWWEGDPIMATDQDQKVLFERIKRAMNTNAPRTAAKVLADLNEDPQIPKRKLEGSHWPSDNDRLLYLRFYTEHLLALHGATVDPVELFMSMVQYEAARADMVGRPPTAQEAQELRRLRTLQSERVAEAELREYLAMVDQIKLQEQTRIMQIDPRMYPHFTHGAAAAGIALQLDKLAALLPVISAIIDFIPFVGTIKGLLESAIGYDIITTEKLSTWQRVLYGLISLLPFAKGIFRAGKEGIRLLARLGAKTKSMEEAEKLYRLMKGVNKLTEEEIRAAMITGKVVNAREVRAAKNLLDKLDEMQGLSQRSWRAVSGTIDNGITTSRSAAGVIDTAAKVPGKVIAETKATEQVVKRLTKVGLSTKAIAQMERTGIQFSSELVSALVKSRTAIEFVNRFQACPGFTELVKDFAISVSKREGALFAMEYAVKKVDPALAKFELGAGITKRVRSTEVAARRVDITAGGISYELKSWRKWTLELALRKPSQLVKDTAIFGRDRVKWVFDSAKITKKEVVEVFKKAVASDPYLKVKWPQGEALDRALDDIIEMFPEPFDHPLAPG